MRFYRKITILFLFLTISLSVFLNIILVKKDKFEKTTASSLIDSSASSMIVLEASTNRILYEQNAYSKKYMASTTKILTAITVIENAKLDDVVKIPKEAINAEGSSIYLKAGEQITVLDLLYGLMLRSGNDAAIALAIHISGSIESFCKLMNETAKKIGAKYSNFVNPHGLHDDNHYTTAYDLAIISTYALKNETFKNIVATKQHVFERERNATMQTFNNKNKILSKFDGGDGVKTGFTKKAGRCLVSSATRNGMQIVAVVLNCSHMFEECSRLMETAFKEYNFTQVLPAYTYVGKASVANGTTKDCKAYSVYPVWYPIKKGEESTIIKTVEFDDLKAPIKTGQKIGKIKIQLYNRVINEQPLYSIDNVKSFGIVDRLKDMLEDWVG